MIEDAKKNKFDIILTKEVSRFARNTIDSIKYTEELLKYGVCVYFLNDNINTIDETCEFRLTIMSSLAQDEVRKLSERVKFGLRRSVKDGKILGGGNITGYYKHNGKLYLNKKEVPIVKTIFELYQTEKYSLKEIGIILYNNGYKNKKNEAYSSRVLSRIITNPKYKGYNCSNKSYIEDYKIHKRKYTDKKDWIIYKDENIPVIIEEELWNKVNEIYNKKYITKEKISIKNTYTNKIICKKCLSKFIRVQTGKRKNNPIWHSLKYHQEGLKKCSSPNIYEKDLNQILINIINKEIDIKNTIINKIQKDYKKMLEKIDKEQKIINNNINIENKLSKLIDLKLDNLISEEEYIKKRNEYLDKKNNSKLTSNNSMININKEINNIFYNSENINYLIELFLDKIYVSTEENNRKNIILDIYFYTQREPIIIKYKSK